MAQSLGPEALLARVLQDTGDAALRQVWADALLEAGDPRGELIAIQIAAAGQPLDGEKDKRARSILAKHAVGWLGPLAPILMHKKGLVFDRGLLKSCQVQVKSVPALEAAVGHPLWGALERIWCCDRFAWDPRIAPLILHPVMRSLRTVVGVGMNNVFPILAASERPLPFTSIQLVDDGFRGGEVDLLSTSMSDYQASLPALRRLGFAWYGNSIDGILALPVVKRVEELALSIDQRVSPTMLEKAARLEKLSAFELRPHFFVTQGEHRAHPVLRFTRDETGAFSKLRLSIAGFTGGVAPRVDLPSRRGRDLTRRIEPFQRHLAGLPSTALSTVELELPRTTETEKTVARFKRASVTFVD